VTDGTTVAGWSLVGVAIGVLLVVVWLVVEFVLFVRSRRG